MRHRMPHERPSAEDTGRLVDHPAIVPALCWAAVLALILASGWVDLMSARDAVALAPAAPGAASQALPAR